MTGLWGHHALCTPTLTPVDRNKTSGVVVPERRSGKHFGAGTAFRVLPGKTLLLQRSGKCLPSRSDLPILKLDGFDVVCAPERRSVNRNSPNAELPQL